MCVCKTLVLSLWRIVLLHTPSTSSQWAFSLLLFKKKHQLNLFSPQNSKKQVPACTTCNMKRAWTACFPCVAFKQCSAVLSSGHSKHPLPLIRLVSLHYRSQSPATCTASPAWTVIVDPSCPATTWCHLRPWQPAPAWTPASLPGSCPRWECPFNCHSWRFTSAITWNGWAQVRCRIWHRPVSLLVCFLAVQYNLICQSDTQFLSIFSSTRTTSPLPARQEVATGAGVYGRRCPGATGLPSTVDQRGSSLSGVQLLNTAGLQAARVQKPNTAAAPPAHSATGIA